MRVEHGKRVVRLYGSLSPNHVELESESEPESDSDDHALLHPGLEFNKEPTIDGALSKHRLESIKGKVIYGHKNIIILVAIVCFHLISYLGR